MSYSYEGSTRLWEDKEKTDKVKKVFLDQDHSIPLHSDAGRTAETSFKFKKATKFWWDIGDENRVVNGDDLIAFLKTKTDEQNIQVQNGVVRVELEGKTLDTKKFKRITLPAETYSAIHDVLVPPNKGPGYC